MEEYLVQYCGMCNIWIVMACSEDDAVEKVWKTKLIPANKDLEAFNEDWNGLNALYAREYLHAVNIKNLNFDGGGIATIL